MVDQEHTITRLCPGCGTAMVFNPETGMLRCPSCQIEIDAFEQDASQVQELDYKEQLEKLLDEELQSECLTVHCDCCGAENVFAENVIADKCAFCGVPLVAPMHSTRRWRPQGVIPFVISKEQASANFAKWLGSRWFLPNKAKSLKNSGTFRGVYRPYWTFDYNTTCNYSGERGEYYYVTVTYTTTENGKTVRRQRQERRTHWYPASGTVYNEFDDILVNASNNMTDVNENGLGPWDLAAAVNYDWDVIRGFQEESYTIPLDTSFETSKSQSTPRIRSNVKSDIGGDEQRIHSMDISYHDITCKHLLLPVWVDSFLYGSKRYFFLVNGQNGTVTGNRPWSAVKITFFIIFLLGVLLVLFQIFASLE